MNRFIFVSFLLALSCNNSSTYTTQVNYVIPSEDLILPILDHYFNQMGQSYNWDLSAVVIRIKNDSDLIQLNISTLLKRDFTWYLIDKKVPILGYFEHDEKSVLVFGDESAHLFTLKDKRIELEYLRLAEVNIPVVKEGEIPRPPVPFEPHVLIYEVKNDTFNFKSGGFYYLLE